MNIHGVHLIPLFLVGILLFSGGCETSLEGQLNDNLPPTTNLTVEQINRTGQARLSSQINISWWGDDPDGFLKGFEVAVNDTAGSDWTFTTRNDSTFILPIPSGNDTADVIFFVRSVDNDDARDPNPASLVFPIKNSTPEVRFKRNPLPPEKRQVPPDSTFNIASFGWSLSDEDGIANIATTEIALNPPEGDWVEIPVEETFISIKAETQANPTADARVFLGTAFRSTETLVNNLKINAENKFAVRVTDQAGAVSEPDTVSWYVRRQTSNILFLQDDASINADAALDFHLSALNDIGLSVDVWDISDGIAERGQSVNLSENLPAVIDPTLQKTLGEWDHIYWLSNSLNRNINFAQEITTDFVDNGGTVFVSIPAIRLQSGSALLDFLAIDQQAQLPSLGTGFALANNSEIRTLNSISSTPPLSTDRIITGIVPFQPIAGAEALLESDFFVTLVTGQVETFDAFGTIAVKNQEGNLIYVGMDLQDLNGGNNVPELLESVLIDELGFNE